MQKKTKVATPPRQGKRLPLPSSTPTRKTSIAKPEIMSKRPKWCFWRMDWDFSINELNAKICNSGSRFSTGTPKIECCLHVLSDRLKGYEKMTWGEIIKQDNTGSHFISIIELKSRNTALHKKFENLMIDDGIDERSHRHSR
jgi:hypothetical protein